MIAHLWLQIWPPARRAGGVWSMWPLVLILGVFPAAAWVLELLDVVVFTSLWPFTLLALVPWIWRLHVAGYCSLSNARASVAVASRLGLLAAFILLFADPRVIRKDEHMSVMFVVDHSDSIIGPMTDSALEYVVKIAGEKPERDEIGLMFFGRNSAVELPPSLSLPYEGAISVRIDRDGTNIAKALSLAAAMLPPETQSRIVLVSDGVETEGPLASVLDELGARGIPVDTLPIDYQFHKEVWLDRLDLPRFVKIGQPFEASVVVSALTHGRGYLTLMQNGAPIGERQAVSYHAGKNRFSIPVELTQSGYYEFSARIEVPKGEDSWENNNTAISFLYLEGRGKVLLVTDTVGREEDWVHLEKALRGGQREVQRVSAFEFPRHTMAMLPYECVVFVNVPRDAFDDQQLQAAHDAVYSQGCGFLMVGGENSYGPGGYQNTPVEDLLPVTMDLTKRKVIPKGALAIVLHTCEFANGNTWGKRITKKAIEVLNPGDEVGVLVYDFNGVDRWLFDLTDVRDRDSMFLAINNAQIGDMPGFAPTMQLALTSLLASDASSRHMIIISDGDPSAPPPSLMQQFVDGKIRVSTVGINPHRAQDVKRLRIVANATGGRFYFPKDPRQLPSIFIKEAKTLRRSAIQNRTFTATIATASPIVKGIGALPPLHGYTWTTPKPRSIVVLDGPEEGEPDPVLAHWRYGVGASVAFTSDLSNRWGKDWVEWGRYSAFVQQVVTEISRSSTGTPKAQLRSYAAGSFGHLVVENFDTDNDLTQVVARVDGPDGNTQRVTLKQVSPRRYEGKFPLQGTGRYQVTALGAGATQSGNVRMYGGFVVSYSPEYTRFRADNVTLDRIRQRTGGRQLDNGVSGKQLYGARGGPRLSSRSIIDWLLLVLACLIPLDVAFRRVQLDWASVRSMLGGSVTATQTLATLREKKEQRDAGESGGHLEPSAPPIRTPAPALDLEKTGTARVATQAPETPKIDKTDDDPPAGSTTSRLLEAKRRARKKEND